MEPSDLPRHQIIETLMAQHTENVAGGAIDLWELMATQIISIVGAGGFSSLYMRSVFLAHSAYPWLAECSLSSQADARFATLRMCFEGQKPAQVSAANSLLLITFTDILASLIGEGLTTSILRSAWGNVAPNRAGKEFKHEQ
jgi:hypothetical protein